MDIYLIQPRSADPVRENMKGSVTLTLTLAYLAAPLIELGLKVKIVDLHATSLDANGVRRMLKEDSPSIVGITCMSDSYSNAIRIANMAKEEIPGCKVVMGGPHVTFTYEETLKDGNIDFVVRGEGDITFPDLVQYILNDREGSLEEIKGIAFRKNGGEVTTTGRYPFIQELDTLPWPARSLMEIQNYDIKGSIFTGRGCIGKCIFCSEKAMFGRQRQRDVNKVIDEIEYLVKDLKIDYIFFMDETFTSFPERTEKLCELMLKKGLRVNWGCESRVDVANRDLLKKMVNAGCNFIQFGGESGSNRILREIRKDITSEEIESAVKFSVETGIQPMCSFMIGHPEDTEETVNETIEFMKRLKKYGCELAGAVCTPFPGTYLFNHAQKLGIEILSSNWDDYRFNNPICNTKYLTAEEIRTLYFKMEEEIYYS